MRQYEYNRIKPLITTCFKSKPEEKDRLGIEKYKYESLWKCIPENSAENEKRKILNI